MIGIGMYLGQILGGFICDIFYKNSLDRLGIYMGVCVMIGIIPISMLINIPSQIGVPNSDVLTPVGVGFFVGLIIVQSNPLKIVILNTNLPENRGTFSLLPTWAML
jgi:hypothetical protein